MKTNIAGKILKGNTLFNINFNWPKKSKLSKNSCVDKSFFIENITLGRIWQQRMKRPKKEMSFEVIVVCYYKKVVFTRINIQLI